MFLFAVHLNWPRIGSVPDQGWGACSWHLLLHVEYRQEQEQQQQRLSMILLIVLRMI